MVVSGALSHIIAPINKLDMSVDKIILNVQDAGQMVPKYNVSIIFTSFTRVHSTLTLARKTLSGIDGNIILVESRNVGT